MTREKHFAEIWPDPSYWPIDAPDVIPAGTRRQIRALKCRGCRFSCGVTYAGEAWSVSISPTCPTPEGCANRCIELGKRFREEDGR